MARGNPGVRSGRNRIRGALIRQLEAFVRQYQKGRLDKTCPFPQLIEELRAGGDVHGIYAFTVDDFLPPGSWMPGRPATYTLTAADELIPEGRG